MESDEEIISKSALGNARKRRDPSLSYALSNAFPRVDSPKLWDVYWGYYESLLRSRGYAAAGISSSEPSEANTSRRLILLALERIIRSYFLSSLIEGEKIYESSAVALKNMSWLVAFSMDTKPEFTLRASEEGPIPSMTNMVGPSNYESSCYCDVVIVSMFLATDAYDSIFDTNLDVFSSDHKPWDDDYLFEFIGDDDPLSWLKNVQPNLRTNPCLKDTRNLEDAKTRITTFKLLLGDLVRGKLREALPADRDENTWAIDQRKVVTEIREFVFRECGGAKLGSPEDASEFFQKIMIITGWDTIALPIRVELWTTEYWIPSLNNLSVRATNSKVVAPDIPIFKIFMTGNPARTLQSVIDANLGRHLDIAEVEKITITDETNAVHLSLKEEADRRNITLPSPGYVVSSRRSYSWTTFARVPDYIVFKLEPESGISRTRTRVTLEEDPTISLPILGIPDDEGADPRISFRVFSVVIHDPGHWWMYFRYPPDYTEAVWYKYDDTSPKITLAIPEELKLDVEDKGTLYFCQRIEQR